MRYVEILISAALLSFLGGLIYATQFVSTNELVERKAIGIHGTNSKLTDAPKKTPYDVMFKDAVKPTTIDDKELPSCSKVNTMPCTASPPNPLKESLDAKIVNNDKLFPKGEKVTCIYPAIKSWTDGNEFVENVAMKCKVIEASVEFADLEPNYQHIKVNCLKDLETKWSDQPGLGMVKGHKLNHVERWFTSSDCYHFQSKD
jgi:hypothetical protein